MVPLFFFIAFFGSMRPNATAIALANQGAIAGTAWPGSARCRSCSALLLSPLAGLAGKAPRPWRASAGLALCVAPCPAYLLIARAHAQRR